ncbi:MAG: aldo/keto reductase, partial [Spirochaetota bacterium]
ECFLATKTTARDHEGAMESIHQSLRRLNTDVIDLMIFHEVQTEEQLKKILSPGGAAEAFDKAKQQGKIRFVGISGHGVPDILVKALVEYDFDAVMTGFNFFDRCNFPSAEDVLIPMANKRETGLIGMKAFADGLLWEYPQQSLRYVLSLPIHTLVVGANTRQMLKKDLEVAESFQPMSEDEQEQLFTTNPVLGTYVCRLCRKCLPCPEGINIPAVFKYEGWYDRQLKDRVVRPPPEYALRDRLRFWFENRLKAKEAYLNLDEKADACTGCGECLPRCPYSIDIISKLDSAHYKLTKETVFYKPI